MQTSTYYEIDGYGRVYRIERTKVAVSDNALALYSYALDKGDQVFLLEYDDTRNVSALELVRCGLFSSGDTRGGYYCYGVQYAERVV